MRAPTPSDPGRPPGGLRPFCGQRFWWIVSAALFLAPSAVWATSELPLSDAELGERADWVGVGRILRARSEWRGRSLVTLVELAVSRTMKGAERGSLTLVVPGGFDVERGVAMQTPGVPEMFPVGARMLVFVRPSPRVANAMTPVSLLSGMRMLPPESESSLRSGAGAGRIQESR